MLYVRCLTFHCSCLSRLCWIISIQLCHFNHFYFYFLGQVHDFLGLLTSSCHNNHHPLTCCSSRVSSWPTQWLEVFLLPPDSGPEPFGPFETGVSYCWELKLADAVFQCVMWISEGLKSPRYLNKWPRQFVWHLLVSLCLLCHRQEKLNPYSDHWLMIQI